MKKAPLIGGLLVAGIVLTGAGCTDTASAPTIPTPPVSDTSTQSVVPALNRMDNTQLNFSADFPSSIFTQSGLTLNSVYYVTDNPSGAPGAGIKHTYTVTFSQTDQSLDDTMKKDNPTAFDQFTKMKSGTAVDPNFISATKVNNHDAYVVTMGVEGINTKTFYVVRSNNQTFIIKLTYIGDSLVSSMKPSALSEADQMKYFMQVLNSVTLK